MYQSQIEMDRQEREIQLSEKINDFPFQRKEGVVVWRGRRWGRGGVWQQICGYNLQILHQKSNYFTIYECKNVIDVSPNRIEHVQITCIFNCLTDYYFNN